MRKPKPITDRSLKGSDRASRISSDRVRPKAIALIERAGFCACDADEVLAGLAIALCSYKNDVEHPEQWPKTGEQRRELQHLVRCATEFNESASRLASALAALSLPARSAILSELPRIPSQVGPLVDPRAHQSLPSVTSPVEGMIAAATRAAQVLPAGNGRRKDPARDLLYRIAIIWHSSERDTRGVTASGTRRRGPLVNFAIEILKLEDSGVSGDSIGRLVRAPAKVGKLLYEVQDEAKNPRSYYEKHLKP